MISHSRPEGNQRSDREGAAPEDQSRRTWRQLLRWVVSEHAHRLLVVAVGVFRDGWRGGTGARIALADEEYVDGRFASSV